MFFCLVVKQPELRLAKLKVNSEFKAPCNTSILYPADGGNMHRFTGVTACAVLDVLGPPYSDPDGRHCTYYHEFPYNKFSGTDLFHLSIHQFKYSVSEVSDHVFHGLCPVDGVTIPEEERSGYAWLQERTERPEELLVDGAPYSGPKIVENWIEFLS